MILFYDLVPYSGGPNFSPFATIVRLALLHKCVPFKPVELTFKQLRSSRWRDGAGEMATVPFIQLEDGTFIRDSRTILRWLDREFPDRPSIFFPGTPLPVNVDSVEYQSAVENGYDFVRKHFSMEKPDRLGYDAVFKLYAPLIAAMLDKEGPDNDFDYFTSYDRLGDRWQASLDADREEQLALVNAHIVDTLERILSSAPNRMFIASPDTPGFADFHVMGMVRMIAASSQENYTRTFARGVVGEWVSKLNDRFAEGQGGMRAVVAKDPN